VSPKRSPLRSGLSAPQPVAILILLEAVLFLSRAQLEVNGQGMGTSDGAAISAESRLEIEAVSEAEIMLFDLA